MKTNNYIVGQPYGKYRIRPEALVSLLEAKGSRIPGNYTMMKAAMACKMSINTLSKMRANMYTHRVSEETAAKMCKYFKVPTNILFDKVQD